MCWMTGWEGGNLINYDSSLCLTSHDRMNVEDVRCYWSKHALRSGSSTECRQLQKKFFKELHLSFSLSTNFNSKLITVIFKITQSREHYNTTEGSWWSKQNFNLPRGESTMSYTAFLLSFFCVSQHFSVSLCVTKHWLTRTWSQLWHWCSQCLNLFQCLLQSAKWIYWPGFQVIGNGIVILLFLFREVVIAVLNHHSYWTFFHSSIRRHLYAFWILVLALRSFTTVIFLLLFGDSLLSGYFLTSLSCNTSKIFLFQFGVKGGN